MILCLDTAGIKACESIAEWKLYNDVRAVHQLFHYLYNNTIKTKGLHDKAKSHDP
jgi:hypothetical protein